MIKMDTLKRYRITLRGLSEETGISRQWLWALLSSRYGADRDEIYHALKKKGECLSNLDATTTEDIFDALKKVGMQKEILVERGVCSRSWLYAISSLGIQSPGKVKLANKLLNKIGRELLKIAEHRSS